MIIGNNLIDYTIDSFSSEDASWPASNLLLFDKRIRYWKTTGTGDSWVIINMGSARTLKAVGVIDCNYTSSRIEQHGTTDFSTPDFNSGALTIVQEKLTYLYRLHFVALTDSYQYLRLFIPTQATTDGDSVFRTGVLAVTEDSEGFLRGPDYGFRMRRNQAKSVDEMHGGGEEKALNGSPYATIAFDLTRPRDQTLFPNHFKQMADQLIKIGETEVIMFAPDDTMIEETNNGQYVFIMRRESEPEIVIPNIGVDTHSVSLREAI